MLNSTNVIAANVAVQSYSDSLTWADMLDPTRIEAMGIEGTFNLSPAEDAAFTLLNQDFGEADLRRIAAVADNPAFAAAVKALALAMASRL